MNEADGSGDRSEAIRSYVVAFACVASAFSVACTESGTRKAALTTSTSAVTYSDVLGLAGWTTYSSPCAGGPGCPQGSVDYCMNQAGGCGRGPRVDTTFTPNQSVDGFPNVAVVFSGDNVDGQCYQCDPSVPSLWGADAFWTVNLPNPPSVAVTSFHWSSDFKVPAGQTYQALEWDSQQSIRGLDPGCAPPSASVLNFGMQYDNDSHHWRFFDYGAGSWVDTGVTDPSPADGSWHTLLADWTVSGTSTTLQSFTFDGNVHPVGRSGRAACKSNYDNSISLGLQLDNVPGNHYTAYYKNYSVTYNTSGSSCDTRPIITEPYDGQSVGSAINLHAHAASCVQSMNVYIDDAFQQTIAGNVSPVPPATSNWIGGYTEGNSHRLVLVGYASGYPDGVSATVNFIWP